MNQNVKYTKVKLVNLSINDEFGIYQSGGSLTEKQIIEKIFLLGIIPYLSKKYPNIQFLNKNPNDLPVLDVKILKGDYAAKLNKYEAFLNGLNYNEEGIKELIKDLFLFEDNLQGADEWRAINNILMQCCGFKSGSIPLMRAKKDIIDKFQKLSDLKENKTYKKYKIYLEQAVNDHIDNYIKFALGFQNKVGIQKPDFGAGALNESLWHNKKILEYLLERENAINSSDSSAKQASAINKNEIDNYGRYQRRKTLNNFFYKTINWDTIISNFKKYVKDDSSDVDAKKKIEQVKAEKKKDTEDKVRIFKERLLEQKKKREQKIRDSDEARKREVEAKKKAKAKKNVGKLRNVITAFRNLGKKKSDKSDSVSDNSDSVSDNPQSDNVSSKSDSVSDVPQLQTTHIKLLEALESMLNNNRMTDQYADLLIQKYEELNQDNKKKYRYLMLKTKYFQLQEYIKKLENALDNKK